MALAGLLGDEREAGVGELDGHFLERERGQERVVEILFEERVGARRRLQVWVNARFGAEQLKRLIGSAR